MESYAVHFLCKHMVLSDIKECNYRLVLMNLKSDLFSFLSRE